MSTNVVVITGNLTRDIELRYTPGGTAVTEVGLAVNERVKRNNEWVDEAVFVDVTLWGRQAELANEYLQKGSKVLFHGRLKLDQWEDRQSGQKRSKLGVVADHMEFLDGNRNGGGGGGGGNRSQGNQQRSQGGGQRSQGGGQRSQGGYQQQPQQQSQEGYDDPDIPF